MDEEEVKRKRKITLPARRAPKTPMKTKTREEINKMRIPGVPYLPPPPDPNMFKKGFECYIFLFQNTKILFL